MLFTYIYSYWLEGMSPMARLHKAWGHVPPTFTNVWHGGAPWVEKQPTKNYQTVLTITKALTKATNYTFRAKKVEGHDQKKNFPALRAGSVPPLSRRTGAPPDFQIRSRSGASGWAPSRTYLPLAP